MVLYQNMIGGFKMPSVGLGTWRATDDEQLRNALNNALQLGYRHIDTAELYGNEAVIGQVLNDWFSSGKLKREELFITTKLSPFSLKADAVENSLKQSINRLGLGYVDLYLLHSCILRVRDPAGNVLPAETDHVAVWKKMEEQVDAGCTKAIGLSNFNSRQIKKIWDSARIKPSCLQVELQPYMQQPELVDFCHKKNIVVVGYSAFGSGGSIPSFSPGQPDIKLPKILEDETLKKIAEKHKRTTAQIVLRFFVQNNVVMIPKSVTSSRLKENLDIFSFSLDENDIKAIRALDQGESGRMVDFGQISPKFKEHSEYPFGK